MISFILAASTTLSLNRSNSNCDTFKSFKRGGSILAEEASLLVFALTILGVAKSLAIELTKKEVLKFLTFPKIFGFKMVDFDLFDSSLL